MKTIVFFLFIFLFIIGGIQLLIFPDMTNGVSMSSVVFGSIGSMWFSIFGKED